MGKRKYDAQALQGFTDSMESVTLAALNKADTDQTFRGLTWYETRHDMLREWADETGHDVRKCAGVMAIMSANKPYRHNLASAHNILSDRAPMYGTATEHDKAYAVLSGDYDAIRGQKVRSFDCNLLNPACDRCVTIDTHMCRLVGLTYHDTERIGVYEALAEGVRRAASKAGLLPQQAQAIAWIVTRGQAF